MRQTIRRFIQFPIGRLPYSELIAIRDENFVATRSNAVISDSLKSGVSTPVRPNCSARLSA